MGERVIRLRTNMQQDTVEEDIKLLAWRARMDRRGAQSAPRSDRGNTQTNGVGVLWWWLGMGGGE